MSQLTFEWPVAASLASEDFIVSHSNAQAFELLQHWPDGANRTLLLNGPEACGKTHLALGWAARHDAIVLDKNALGSMDSASLWSAGPCALLEDIHTVRDETALFHLLRFAETQGNRLLLTSRLHAQALPFALPDLRSRLLALPQARIGTPDEALLQAFLFKCFADRQLRISQEALAYIARRMDRSFTAAFAQVELLERKALEQGREITIPFLKSF